MYIRAELEQQLDDLIPKFNYIAFFSNESEISTEDTISSKSELFRIAVTPVRSNQNLIISYTIPSDKYCPNSTVSSASSNTQFTLVSATGFIVGDRIQIRIPGNYLDRKISAKSGNIITVSESIGMTLTSGIEVIVKCSQVGLIRDGSSGANTGSLAFLFPENFAKKEGSTIPGTMTIPMKGT
jgi:hypothetical protein